MNGAPARRVMLVQTQAENAGAQQISRMLAADFAARGYDVRQVFFFRRTASFDQSANVEFCASERPGRPIAFLRFLIRLYAVLRESRPDVVIAFQHYGNIIAAPVARLAGVKSVIANQVSAEAMMGRAIFAADRFLGTSGVYDRIVVNSDHTAKMFEAYPPSYRKRVVRIDHGFEDKTLSLSPGQARGELGLPLDVPLLGCVARLHPLKQLDAAIRALALIEGAHLALAGQGQDLPRLEALARELGVIDRVHFLGEISPRKVGVLLAALNCFVFPSTSETFGLAPVEAAQAGVPVIANNIEVLREVLSVDDEPCAVFVEATDSAAFAAAIRHVLDDSAAAARLSAAGRRLKQRYPLSRMTDAYAGLMNELIGRA